MLHFCYEQTKPASHSCGQAGWLACGGHSWAQLAGDHTACLMCQSLFLVHLWAVQVGHNVLLLLTKRPSSIHKHLVPSAFVCNEAGVPGAQPNQRSTVLLFGFATH